MAQMTLWGMYQFDQSMFDMMHLPIEISLPDFIDYLMMEIGDLYPYHQVPPKLKSNIGIWSKYRVQAWNRMLYALNKDYNPIENYDRYEDLTEKDVHSGTDTSQDSGTDTTRNTGTDTSKDSGNDVRRDDLGTSNTQAHSGSVTDNTSVSAYDQSGYTPREQTIHDYNETITDTKSGADTMTTTYGKTNELIHGHQQDNIYGRKNDFNHGHILDVTHKNHIHGNIGVTTNQKMITQEIEMRSRYQIMQIITDEFADRFLSKYYGF